VYRNDTTYLLRSGIPLGLFTVAWVALLAAPAFAGAGEAAEAAAQPEAGTTEEVVG